jgi:isopentenyldiphosphate isomerase
VKDNQPEEVVEGAIVPNENEVCNLRYVSQKELRQMFEECMCYISLRGLLDLITCLLNVKAQKYSFTPWFRKIYEDPDLLAGWWGELENSGVKDAFGVKAQDKHKFLVRCPC